MNTSMKPRVPIAVFVSRQASGRATAAAALIKALYQRWAFARFHVFTTLPENFFKAELAALPSGHWTYHWYPAAVRAAVQEGVLPTHAAVCNCPAPTRPAPDGDTGVLAYRLFELGCLMVVSDTAQWGVDAAEKAG